jgi:hypothetical protein
VNGATTAIVKVDPALAPPELEVLPHATRTHAVSVAAAAKLMARSALTDDLSVAMVLLL